MNTEFKFLKKEKQFEEEVQIFDFGAFIIEQHYNKFGEEQLVIARFPTGEILGYYDDIYYPTLLFKNIFDDADHDKIDLFFKQSLQFIIKGNEIEIVEEERGK